MGRSASTLPLLSAGCKYWIYSQVSAMGSCDAGTCNAGTCDAGTCDAGTCNAGTCGAGTCGAGTCGAGTCGLDLLPFTCAAFKFDKDHTFPWWAQVIFPTAQRVCWNWCHFQAMSTSPKTCTCSTHAHAFSGDGNGVGDGVPLDETGSWQVNRLSRCPSFNLQKVRAFAKEPLLYLLFSPASEKISRISFIARATKVSSSFPFGTWQRKALRISFLASWFVIHVFCVFFFFFVFLFREIRDSFCRSLRRCWLGLSYLFSQLVEVGIAGIAFFGQLLHVCS